MIYSEAVCDLPGGFFSVGRKRKGVRGAAVAMAVVGREALTVHALCAKKRYSNWHQISCGITYE